MLTYVRISAFLKQSNGDVVLQFLSTRQLFSSVQHRHGKQKAVQAKSVSYRASVMRGSPAYSASPRSSAASLEHCGDVELTPISAVRALQEKGSSKRTLIIETPTREAKKAWNGNTSLISFPVKSDDLRHNTQTSESIGSTYDRDDICKGEIFDEEFAAFRKPAQSSTTMQPSVSAALNALHLAASKGQILHIEKIPAR